MASQFPAHPDPDYAYDLREFWPNSDPDWIWPLKKSQKSDPERDMASSSTVLSGVLSAPMLDWVRLLHSFRTLLMLCVSLDRLCNV